MALTPEVMQALQVMLQLTVEQAMDRKLSGICANMESFDSKFEQVFARLSALEDCDMSSSIGSAKRARSSPSVSGRPAGSGAASSSSALDEDKKRDLLTKIRISMHNQQRVKKEDVVHAFAKVTQSANVEHTYEIRGPTIGHAYTVAFSGGFDTAASRVKQLLGSLRKPDGSWLDCFIPSPRDGEPAIRMYIAAERSVEQRQREFHWRALRKAVAAVSEKEWTFEARDKVIYYNFHPIVRVAFDFRTKEYGLAWFTAPKAMDALCAADRARVANEYASIVDRGPQRG